MFRKAYSPHPRRASHCRWGAADMCDCTCTIRPSRDLDRFVRATVRPPQMTFLIPTYRIGGLERDQRSVRDAAPESGGEAANQEDDEHGRAGEKQEPDDLLQEGATWPAVRERARARRVPEDKDAHGSHPTAIAIPTTIVTRPPCHPATKAASARATTRTHSICRYYAQWRPRSVARTRPRRSADVRPRTPQAFRGGSFAGHRPASR